MRPRYRIDADRTPHWRNRPLAVVLLILLGTSVAQSAILRVGQPGEPGCDQPSLQAAINAAAASPGLDIIRVSVGSYVGQLLLVNDSGDLAIEGGFLSCSTPVANAGTTTLSAQGTPGGSVISHLGSGRLTLSDLGITAGDASAGGGVYSPGAAPLTLRRVQIYNNRANAGGGLSVGNNNAGALKEVNLQGVAFTSNVAQSMGGGIYAVRAHVRITGDSPNQFLANWAHGAHPILGGGAIYANNSQLFIHSLAPVLGAFMDSNLANQGSGGAIAFIGSGPGYFGLTMMNRSGSQPLRIANNAAQRGAAISVQSGNGTGTIYTGATLYNAIIEDNQAGSSIIDVDAYSTNHLSHASLGLSTSTFGMVAPSCPPSLRCNRLESNDGGGSSVWVSSGGGSGHAVFSMHRGHMLDNFSTGHLLSGTGPIRIYSSVLGGNVSSIDSLLSGIGNEIHVQDSTIAENFIGSGHVFGSALPGASLTVHNSIVFQPGKQFHSVTSPVAVNLRNLLVNQDHGLVDLFPRNIQPTADPSFVNPGQNDFRLLPWSQAINRWSPGGDVQVPAVDLLGGTRPADPPGTPTPYDFGAHEYGAVVDGIFIGSFDG